MIAFVENRRDIQEKSSLYVMVIPSINGDIMGGPEFISRLRHYILKEREVEDFEALSGIFKGNFN